MNLIAWLWYFTHAPVGYRTTTPTLRATTAALLVCAPLCDNSDTCDTEKNRSGFGAQGIAVVYMGSECAPHTVPHHIKYVLVDMYTAAVPYSGASII